MYAAAKTLGFVEENIFVCNMTAPLWLVSSSMSLEHHSTAWISQTKATCLWFLEIKGVHGKTARFKISICRTSIGAVELDIHQWMRQVIERCSGPQYPLSKTGFYPLPINIVS